HLADLGADELVVAHHAIRARRRVRGIARTHERVGPLPEQGHAPLVDLADLVDLPRLHQADGLEDLVGGDPVGGPGLVAAAPLGIGPAGAGVARLGAGAHGRYDETRRQQRSLHVPSAGAIAPQRRPSSAPAISRASVLRSRSPRLARMTMVTPSSGKRSTI